MLNAHALLRHRGLQVKLHPWSDRRAHKANNHVQVCRIVKVMKRWRTHSIDHRRTPVRMSENASDDVSDIKERGAQEDFLNACVRAFHHDEPHNHGTHGNADVAANAEQLQASRDS